VKVCGITRAEDAQALDELGVDYLGFNFWPRSKRYITPEAAAPLIAALRHAEAVGVFVDHTPEEIARIAAITGIRSAQLHGSETWDVIAQVELPVIKAIPHTQLAEWGGLRPNWDARAEVDHPRQFLVDTATASAFGGTGAAFDWKTLDRAHLPRPLFLAGGLGPHNLAEAVRIARPFGLYAVDLNSKVETAPGVKDVKAVERCLAITVDAGPRSHL
jgi:phosphoribosylanthranilate isomerase